MLINTPAIQKPLGAKFPPLSPPLPLGHHLPPLGQNFELIDFWVSLLQNSFTDGNDAVLNWSKFDNLVNKNNVVTTSNNDDINNCVSIDSNTPPQAVEASVVYENIVLPKVLELPKPITYKSDLLGSNLVTEIVSEAGDITENIQTKSIESTAVTPFNSYPPKTPPTVQIQEIPNPETALLPKSVAKEPTENIKTLVQNISKWEEINLSVVNNSQLVSPRSEESTEPLDNLFTAIAESQTKIDTDANTLQTRSEIVNEPTPSILPKSTNTYEPLNEVENFTDSITEPSKTVDIDAIVVQSDELVIEPSDLLKSDFTSTSRSDRISEARVRSPESPIKSSQSPAAANPHSLSPEGTLSSPFAGSIEKNESTAHTERTNNLNLDISLANLEESENPSAHSEAGLTAVQPQTEVKTTLFSVQPVISSDGDEPKHSSFVSVSLDITSAPPPLESEPLVTEPLQRSQPLSDTIAFREDVAQSIAIAPQLETKATLATSTQLSFTSDIVKTQSEVEAKLSTQPQVEVPFDRTTFSPAEISSKIPDTQSIPSEPQRLYKPQIPLNPASQASTFSSTDIESVAVKSQIETEAIPITPEQLELVSEEKTSTSTDVELVKLKPQSNNLPTLPSQDTDLIVNSSITIESQLQIEETPSTFEQIASTAEQSTLTRSDAENTVSNSIQIKEKLNLKLPISTQLVPNQEITGSILLPNTIIDNTKSIAKEGTTAHPQKLEKFKDKAAIIASPWQNLNPYYIQFLSQSLPLLNYSDFQLSELVAEFFNTFLPTEEITRLSENQIKNQLTSNAENIPAFSDNLENLSPTKEDAFNFSPSLLKKRARGLDVGLVFSSDVKNQEKMLDVSTNNSTELSSPDTNKNDTNLPTLLSLWLTKTVHSINRSSLSSFVALNASIEGEPSKTHISNDKSSSEIMHIDNQNISEEWQSIAELLNHTSRDSVENMPLPILSNTNQSIQLLNNWNLLTLANFSDGNNQESTNTFTHEKVDDFQLILNPEQRSNNTPYIWSNITELLGENIPSPGVNSSQTNEEEFAILSASDSTTTQTSLIELCNPSLSVSQEQTINLERAEVNTSNYLISEDEMEMLIYQVYITLCHRLKLNHKTQLYPGTSIHNSWNQNFWKAYPRYSTGNWTTTEVRSISDDSKIAGNYNDVFLLDSKISILAQEVYALIKHRLNLKKMRDGNESLYRFML
ncbi:hypothetical protein [Nostoc sp. NMS9]|uniref:hypothetical protein n=1 Tax=Nostoc sp. NMS9 TaxID=2815393 RepID=UPI0025FEA8A4|nr:hypothetical protein [Nostoc sp. NMS9]MBN3941452.1 hypothetical protein [Nostoc sp. NMS9]